MNEKQVDNKLYVLSFIPYVIEPAAGVDIIYVQQEKLADFVKLNPTLADKFATINYLVMTVKDPEWVDSDDGGGEDEPVEPTVYELQVHGTGLSGNVEVYVNDQLVDASEGTDTIAGVTIKICNTEDLANYTVVSSTVQMTYDTDHWEFEMPEADVEVVIDYAEPQVVAPEFTVPYLIIKGNETINKSAFISNANLIESDRLVYDGAGGEALDDNDYCTLTATAITGKSNYTLEMNYAMTYDNVEQSIPVYLIPTTNEQQNILDQLKSASLDLTTGTGDDLHVYITEDAVTNWNATNLRANLDKWWPVIKYANVVTADDGNEQVECDYDNNQIGDYSNDVVYFGVASSSIDWDPLNEGLVIIEIVFATGSNIMKLMTDVPIGTTNNPVTLRGCSVKQDATDNSIMLWALAGTALTFNDPLDVTWAQFPSTAFTITRSGIQKTLTLNTLTTVPEYVILYDSSLQMFDTSVISTYNNIGEDRVKLTATYTPEDQNLMPLGGTITTSALLSDTSNLFVPKSSVSSISFEIVPSETDERSIAAAYYQLEDDSGNTSMNPIDDPISGGLIVGDNVAYVIISWDTEYVLVGNSEFIPVGSAWAGMGNMGQGGDNTLEFEASSGDTISMTDMYQAAYELGWDPYVFAFNIGDPDDSQYEGPSYDSLGGVSDGWTFTYALDDTASEYLEIANIDNTGIWFNVLDAGTGGKIIVTATNSNYPNESIWQSYDVTILTPSPEES